MFLEFLVLSLADTSSAPAFADNPVAMAARHEFNAQLVLDIPGLRNNGYNIITFDTDRVTREILADFADDSPLCGVTKLIAPGAVSMITPGPPPRDLTLGASPNAGRAASLRPL